MHMTCSCWLHVGAPLVDYLYIYMHAYMCVCIESGIIISMDKASCLLPGFQGQV
jgi:hypothetical protein